jgi:molybdenum cofactor cytidylyltransferase
MVSALILAAGLSKRMGKENKMLLPYKGKTIIAATVDNIILSGITEIIIVTGFEREKVEAALSGIPVCFVHNRAYEDGMTTSIQRGVTVAEGDGYMICLADMLHIIPAEYTLLNNSFSLQFAVDPACIILPVYGDKNGNPVIFSKHYKADILQHKSMEGCKAIVQDNKEHLIKVQMPTDHVLMDLDYPDDYKKLELG